jgi:hypothetical protein
MTTSYKAKTAAVMPKSTNKVRTTDGIGKPRSKKATAQLIKGLSRSVKNKIWHNWLTEENYLF